MLAQTGLHPACSRRGSRTSAAMNWVAFPLHSCYILFQVADQRPLEFFRGADDRDFQREPRDLVAAAKTLRCNTGAGEKPWLPRGPPPEELLVWRLVCVRNSLEG